VDTIGVIAQMKTNLAQQSFVEMKL